jgi:multidrug efflux system outer membrane protein
MKLNRYLITSSLFFASCAIGPDYKKPELQLPKNFSTKSKDFKVVQETNSKWWQAFNDQLLNELVDHALANNKDLAAALSRIDQSRSLSDRAFGELFPLSQINSSQDKGRNSGARFPSGTTRSGFDYEAYNVSLEAIWELDFFGRLRRDLEARKADFDASQADYQNTILVLLSDLCQQYLKLRSLQEQLDVTKYALDIQKKTKKIVADKFQFGEASELDMARVKTAVSSARANIPNLKQQINKSARRIAVLTGQNPEALLDKLLVRKEIPEYKAKLEITNPDEMIRQRPDVQVAERQLAAYTASIGVAIGEIFPKVSLTGTFGLEAGAFDLLNSKAKTFRYGPSMSWTPLYTGRVRSKIKLARAQAKQALHQYEQQVLLALEDSANVLDTFNSQKRRLITLKKAEISAKNAYEIADFQYQEGLIDLLNVLDVQNNYLQARQSLILSQESMSLSIVAINKAFGSGMRI